ncbi:MAG: EAL domain-containing response regulator [Methyloligellaceae bacterium]
MDQKNNQLNTVLIVDDDIVLRSVASSFFTQQGVKQVLEADNGKAALEYVEEHGSQIDFILCDLQMPEMDGFQLLRHLNNLNYKGAISILSGFETTIIELARDLAEHHQLKIVGALQKPLDFETLQNIYQFLIDQEQDKAPEKVFELLEEDLETAINSRKILPYYQPKISLTTGHIVGAEVINYWDHHIYGLLPATQYMEMARTAGLINNLETLQLETALEDIKQFKNISDSFTVSLNIDMDMLGNHAFPDLINFMVESNKLDISNLIIEVNSNQIKGKKADLIEILARLKTHGVSFSLDHLAVSMSSHEDISHLPFSEIKLDKTIVKDAFKTPYAGEHMKSHIQFGKSKNFKITGVGAETPGDIEYLARNGVDFAQGYFPAKPMPLSTILQWFQEYESKLKKAV